MHRLRGGMLIWLASWFALAGCADREVPAVHVLAAASLTSALEEIFQTEVDSGRVVLNFAASSTLARQIVAGAPADVFLCADDAWAEWLVERQGPSRDHRILVRNRLVLVARRGSRVAWSPASGARLADEFSGRLAVGDPDHVPAGRYARTALAELGAWADVESRLAPAADVRAALALVESGQCEAGIVYATDARASSRVSVVSELPDPPGGISYPAVRLTDSPEVLEIWRKLSTPGSVQILQKHGFVATTSAEIEVNSQ